MPYAAVQSNSRAAPAEDGAASPRWILIADDDDLIRSLWNEMLTQAFASKVAGSTLKPAPGGPPSTS